MQRENPFLVLLIFCLFFSGLCYAQPISSQRWELRVKVNEARIYHEPDVKSRVVTMVAISSILLSYEKTENWFRVIIGPDDEGFFFIGYIQAGAVDITSQKTSEEPVYWMEKPGSFQGIGLEVKIAGGMSYFAEGDFERGTRGLYDSFVDLASTKGYPIEREIKSLHSSLDFSGEIIYRFTPRLGVGLGVGLVQTTKKSYFFMHEEYSNEHTMTSVPMISSIPLKLGIYYILPFNRFFNFFLNTGAAVYFTKYGYTRLVKLMGTEEIRQKASTKNLGIHGCIGLEFNFHPRGALLIEAEARYARISNFEGESLIRKYSPYFIDMTYDIKKKGKLYYLEGEKYSSLSIMEQEPSGYQTARKAVLDLSGIVVRVGLKYRF